MMHDDGNFIFITDEWAYDHENECPALWHVHDLEVVQVWVANTTSGDVEVTTHCPCGAEIPAEVLVEYLDEVSP